MTVNLPIESATRQRVRARIPVLPAVAAVVVLAVVVSATLGEWLVPVDPGRQDLLLGSVTPSREHLLGTDELGRDVLSRIMVGARPALVGPVLVALGAVLCGAGLGLLAGYRGGLTDMVVSRLADLVYALPALLVAVVVVGVMQGGYRTAVAVLVFLSVPSAIRMCRSAAVVQARLPYVDAARTLGLPGFRILWRHLLPNILPTVLATFLLDFVSALVGFAALAFLGLGVEPGGADWGTMLADGQQLITVNPWVALAPAIMIVTTATSVTVLGDWVYDRLSGGGRRA